MKHVTYRIALNELKRAKFNKVFAARSFFFFYLEPLQIRAIVIYSKKERKKERKQNKIKLRDILVRTIANFCHEISKTLVTFVDEKTKRKRESKNLYMMLINWTVTRFRGLSEGNKKMFNVAMFRATIYIRTHVRTCVGHCLYPW